MGVLSQPDDWIDGFDNTPPLQWEALETDDRWWWDNSTGNVNSRGLITYIGSDSLPKTLVFNWEIVIPPTQGTLAFRYQYNAEVGDIDIDIGSDVGTGIITLNPNEFWVPSEFMWGIRSTESDTSPYTYQAIVAVGEGTTGPAELQYGTVIRIVEKDALDSFSSAWSTASTHTPGPNLDYYKCYAMDGNDPLAFWLWPRGYEGADVIVTYAGVPPAVTATDTTLVLSDMYVGALADYVVYRALSKESRAGAKEVAQSFLMSFMTAIGASRQILKAIGQNTTRPPDAEA